MSARFRVESLLSARLFVAPQLVEDKLYFISDLSGRLSLYVMRVGGSVPEPLIPPDIALPNPHHFEGSLPYRVLPRLGKILLLLDQDGDENYQPYFVPIAGGIPVLVFGDRFAGRQVICQKCDESRNLAFLHVDLRTEPVQQSYLVDLATLELTDLGQSKYGNVCAGISDDFSQVILADGYTTGDSVYYRWQRGDAERQLLYGTPLDARPAGSESIINGIGGCEFTDGDGLLFTSTLFDDRFDLSYLKLHQPETVHPVQVIGLRHQGEGELERIEQRAHNRYTLTYNIDGTSWVYEGQFDEQTLRFQVKDVICGEGTLSNGVLAAIDYEKSTGRYALAFSTAISPVQLYIVDGATVRQQTNERVLGIEPGVLAAGEDASFTSHDGLRISARLYLPSPDLGYAGKRPVIFYIHGGPQSQERPDFTWFSMPLIQYFTLNGFAVFVPNVRGSTGYGMAYTKRIDRDWGGLDRLDHIAAFAQLRSDPRLDLDRAGVMGRSYGGYMTLIQVGMHADLWRAACDMFGPFNLFTFLDRIPETWKPYFHMALGDPEKDKEFLIERSPNTHLDNLRCPLLVIQGANDPRVVEQESSDLVADLKGQGKEVEYIVFEDEGHDVIKYQNKVVCYSRIVQFFAEHLKP